MVNGPRTDHHIRPAVQNRLNQLLDIFSTVLVVGICIDYNVSAVPKTAVQSCHKPFGKSFILFETDNMVHAPSSCHFHRIVPAAVIDDQIFDFFNSLQRFWQIIQCDLQRLRLVIAGDLN